MTMTKRPIGYIGLGMMGGGMAAHLVRSGFPVTVFDPRDEAIEAVLEFGAERGASPSDVAARSEIIVTSLPNPAIVETVALGENGIIHGARAGTVYIDMSSIEPDTTRRVGAALAVRGVDMLDVPVGKGPPAAAKGDLTLMVGGDPEVVERVADVLDTLGSKRFYCGPLGAGVTTKLVNNLVSTAICAITGEAMAVGAAAGLEPEVMLAVMSNTAADSAHLRNAITHRVLTGDFSPNFKLSLAHKDLGLATALAASVGVPALMGAAAYQLHTLALGAGFGDDDQSATIKVLEACTGVPARARGANTSPVR
jgi:4-hydroxybutyrate dehydrogenase / sulfolactaldehyde 3-reductase